MARTGRAMGSILLAAVLVSCNAFVNPTGLRTERPSVRRASGRGERSLRLQLDWSRVSIADVKPAAEGLVHVVINGGDALASYTTPGQYVQLKPHSPGAKASFFAIASAPDKTGRGVAEFLIKRTDGSAWLCDARAGEEIDMSLPQGKGFQIQDFDKDGVSLVVMCAAGSGIAPIRAAIESDELGLSTVSRRARLYYGVRTPEHLAYLDRFDSWRERGVNIVPVFSKTPAHMDHSNSYNGYIQNVLEGHELQFPARTGALMCGMKEMTMLSTRVLKEKGVAPERILLNF